MRIFASTVTTWIATLAIAALGIAAILPTLIPASAQEDEPVTVTFTSAGDAVSFDPHALNEGGTSMLLQHVYETLTTVDPELNQIPSLATEWTLSEDGLVWDIKIREGVTFHDGTPLTAEDVVFSLKRGASQMSDYRVFFNQVEEIEATGTHSIRLTTSEPNPLQLKSIAGVFIMSKAWAEKHGVERVQDRVSGQETYAVRHANGTGPFKLETREPGVQTVFVRNDDWWNEEPRQQTNIERLIHRPITNNATRIAALLSGELDFVLDPPFQDLRRLERTDGLKLVDTVQTRTIFLVMDQGRDELRHSDIKGKNPFADRRVREALYRAINIEAIRRVIMRGRAKPAGMLISPAVDGWSKELDTRLEYDPERARALLAEAGYGEGLELRLDCPNDRYLNDEAICNALVPMFKRIGVEIDLLARPKSIFFQSLDADESDFHMLGWGLSTPDSQFVFDYLYREGAHFNRTGYTDPEAQELFNKVRTEIDPDKRAEHIRQAWEKVTTDIVYLPLHHQMIVWAMSERLNMPIRADNLADFSWATVEE